MTNEESISSPRAPAQVPEKELLAKLTELEKKLGEIKYFIQNIEPRIMKLESRLSALDFSITNLEPRFNFLEAKIAHIEYMLARIEKKLYKKSKWKIF